MHAPSVAGYVNTKPWLEAMLQCSVNADIGKIDGHAR